MLGEQALHMCIEAAFDFGFDVRGEVVDHILHDRLRRGAQLFVQMNQQGVRGFFGLGRRGYAGQRYLGRFGLLADDFRKQRDLRNLRTFAAHHLGQQGRLQVFIPQ